MSERHTSMRFSIYIYYIYEGCGIALEFECVEGARSTLSQDETFHRD